jgi:hypothetical protein
MRELFQPERSSDLCCISVIVELCKISSLFIIPLYGQPPLESNNLYVYLLQVFIWGGVEPSDGLPTLRLPSPSSIASHYAS